MTIQNLFIAELSDILRIQLECKCGARVAMMPDGSKLPFKCPQCDASWRTGHYEVEILENLLLWLNKAREQQQSSENVRLGLAFDLDKIPTSKC